MELPEVDALVRPHADELVDAAVRSAATDGGPFAAMVLDRSTGAVLGRATNRVTSSCDPTAHAEVGAIREATTRLSRPDLGGTVLLASCEPCLMCLVAGLWARVDAIVHLASRRDAATAGFDDELFYASLGIPEELPPAVAGVPVVRWDHPRAREPFRAWLANGDRIPY